MTASLVVRRVAPVSWLFWPATAVAFGLALAGTGLLPIVPLVGLVGLAVLLATRMQVSALAVLALALFVDNPGERPHEGLWTSPTSAIGSLVYDNLRQHVGIDALRFSALELLLGVLLVVLISRRLRSDRGDDPSLLGLRANPMKVAFGVYFAALVWLEVYGIGRGGDFRNSLWQMRQLFWLPLLGVLFGNALKTAGSRVALLRIFMVVAWVRCLVGIYFTYAIVHPYGLSVEYTMTHSDAILTVVALLAGLAAFVERPSVGHFVMNLVLQPVLVAGLMVNDRRIAYVALVGGGLALVLLGPAFLRRLCKQGLLVMVPLLALYVGIGWHSNAAVFGPVATLRAMSSSEDASSQTRDIENYNLIQTLKARPLIGSGFGHEYNEVVQAYRVDSIFAQYRFIAHNSVLWLLSIAGGIGFTLLWAVFPVGVAVALGVHRRATTTIDRLVAFTTVAAIISFVVQAWGDMGLQSWMGTLVVTSLMGATGAMHTAQQREGELA